MNYNGIKNWWLIAGGISLGIALADASMKDATQVPADIAKRRADERKRSALFYLVAGTFVVLVGLKGFETK